MTISTSLACEVLVNNIDDLSYGEWLAIRRQGIGGSDVAAALGLSPWKSSLELYSEKTGEMLQANHETNEALLWGRILEPVIRNEFGKRTGYPVKPMRSMLQHPCFPFMLADLDGLVEVPGQGLGVLEIKTASSFKQSEWDDGKVPDYYLLQVQHYLSVSGLDFAIVCVLLGGNQLKWSRVDADPDLIESLITLESEFWRHVTGKNPPPVDGSSACAGLLSSKYPTSNNPSTLILPSEADAWIQDYLLAKADEDAAIERKRLAENRLKAAMGEHEKAISAVGNQVSWKTVSSSRIDTARLKTEQPAILERYASTVTSRRFSISEGK